MPTINDVAKKAKVSKGTVSNAFSGKRPISKEVREKVLKAAKELGYEPNYIARSLATKETKIIGINMLKGENVKFNQFHLSLLNGVLKVCYENGYRLLVNTLSEDDQFKSLDPVDGEIILNPSINDKRIDKRLKKRIPIVIVGKPCEKYEKLVSYVDNDNINLSKDITDSLLNLGYDNILFFNSLKNRTVSKDRLEGYKLAFKNKFGKESKNYNIFHNVSYVSSFEYGYNTTKQLIEENRTIKVIIADNDKVSKGICMAIKESSTYELKDILIVVFSNDMYSNDFMPFIMNVYLNPEALGREAAKTLIDEIKIKDNVHKKIIIDSNFDLRGFKR
ncbi:LacI family DNA-binding transcriptional regulator [Clostridium oceanicum]|uniref:Maltose operon transcriptional repressor MalR n=1 Tax=Clostridium oceanicum TaxID=1543 RepID=A0ABN1J8L6_9CLOT